MSAKSRPRVPDEPYRAPLPVPPDPYRKAWASWRWRRTLMASSGVVAILLSIGVVAAFILMKGHALTCLGALGFSILACGMLSRPAQLFRCPRCGEMFLRVRKDAVTRVDLLKCAHCGITSGTPKSEVEADSRAP
jgi:hypothetical protein